MRDLHEVENALGYTFTDKTLLDRALTHASAWGENNEALAWMGDRIYSVWVARRLVCRGHTLHTKGWLTDAAKDLCSRRAQEEIFFELGLGPHLAVGGAISGSHYSVTTSMASTALEAVVAAIELDGGREAAEAFLDRVLALSLDTAISIRE